MNGEKLSVVELDGIISNLGLGESIVIYNLDSKIYRGADAISNSDLGMIKESPAQLIWAKNAPVDPDKLKSLDIGSAAHCKLLEPEKFDLEFAVEPEINKRTNAGKAEAERFAEDNKDKIIITADDNKRIDFMVRSAISHPTFSQLLSSGDSEVSVFWRDSNTGLACKCRPDRLAEVSGIWFCLDVKTTDDISRFDKSIGDFDYHRQQAFYTEGLTVAGMPPVFLFGVISKSASCGRYPVAVKSLDRDDVMAGENQFTALLQTFAQCRDSGTYSGVSQICRTKWARIDDIYSNQNQ